MAKVQKKTAAPSNGYSLILLSLNNWDKKHNTPVFSILFANNCVIHKARGKGILEQFSRSRFQDRGGFFCWYASGKKKAKECGFESCSNIPFPLGYNHVMHKR